MPRASFMAARRSAGRLLIAIDGHEHGDPREKMSCPLDDAEMTRCNGVERAGIDRMLFSRNSPPAWTTGPPYAGRAPRTVPRSPQALSQQSRSVCRSAQE
jgi:hypothetical protein